MRLAFFTNIPSHHQIPLGSAFAERLGKDFTLVCWETGHDERKAMGWSEDYDFEWLLIVGNSDEKRQRALEILRTADVVIWGYAPYEIILERLSKGKLTFRYTERPYKEGRWRLIDPRYLRAVRRMKRLDVPNHHLLAAGAYCADDFRFIRQFKHRMWKWGYFPEPPQMPAVHVSNPTPTVLWAGRLLDWKQVDLLLEAVKWVRDRGSTFKLNLIGDGPEKERLTALTDEYGLSDVVSFSPFQKPADIIDAMQNADIYVLSSNKYEGWGVVVNEAMSCGCCVIGSKLAGSVPWLIQDGISGFQFDGKTVEDLGAKLLYCLEHPDRRLEIGHAAHATIANLWSPTVAATRFLLLCEDLILKKSPPFFDDGPCSKA